MKAVAAAAAADEDGVRVRCGLPLVAASCAGDRLTPSCARFSVAASFMADAALALSAPAG